MKRSTKISLGKYLYLKIFRKKFKEFVTRMYSDKTVINKDEIASTANSTSLVVSTNSDVNDICFSENSNTEYSKVILQTHKDSDSDLEIIDTLPKQKKFLEKPNQIVPFNKDLANRIILKEDLDKKFASLYVLNFIQDEDIFEYFRSIVDNDYDANVLKKENEKVNVDNSKKIRTVKDCKYLYMIVENPKNRNESYQLGLKVVDIVPTNSSNKY